MRSVNLFVHFKHFISVPGILLQKVDRLIDGPYADDPEFFLAAHVLQRFSGYLRQNADLKSQFFCLRHSLFRHRHSADLSA